MVGTECRTRQTVGVTIGAVANLVGWIATESVWIVFHALDRLPSTRSGRRVLRLLAGERRGIASAIPRSDSGGSGRVTRAEASFISTLECRVSQYCLQVAA